MSSGVAKAPGGGASTDAPLAAQLTREELRRIAQPPEYSPSRTDRFYRAFSIYLSIPLSKWGATPNGITVVWILIGLAGAACILSSIWIVRVGGGLLLEFSYLLDFVDGEVARITRRSSTVGGFLDLMGHGLIKTALPLAAGASVFAQTGSRFMFLAGAVGAVTIGVGDSLRFYAACTSGRLRTADLDHVAALERRPLRELPLIKLIGGLFGHGFESEGLFGLALLGGLFDRLGLLTIYWMIAGPIWMCLRANDYSKRLRALDTMTALDRNTASSTAAPE